MKQFMDTATSHLAGRRELQGAVKNGRFLKAERGAEKKNLFTGNALF